ncbi:MAG: hypothetical protein LLG20_14580 [Acidobacteriales bacterium]|nr:hypothetical protein [Terriglobales bacterium]
MLKHPYSQVKVMTVLGLCALIAPSLLTAEDARVTAVKLSVEVDDSSNCKLSLNATVVTNGRGTVWYNFQGPDGVSFDMGKDGTMPVLSKGGGLGKGVTIKQDIKGEFRLEAAMEGEGGKRGPVVLSNPVPANYTCAGGSSVARPIGGAAATPARQRR